MVRTSVVQLIFFIALVSVSAMFVGTVVTEAGLYSQAIDDRSDREAAAIHTEITIINDDETDANYDGENVILYVKNVGGETIEPGDLEVLVAGEYATITDTEVLEGDHWREGRVAEIQAEGDCEPGDCRVTAQAHGDEAFLEFEYRVAFWAEEQDELEENGDDADYTVDASEDEFTVTMETDPVQDGEEVEYEVEYDGDGTVEIDGEETSSEGETNDEGEDETTVELEDVEEGETIELTLETGWDSDTIVIEVVDGTEE